MGIPIKNLHTVKTWCITARHVRMISRGLLLKKTGLEQGGVGCACLVDVEALEYKRNKCGRGKR